MTTETIRILCVDDEPLDRALIRHALENEGEGLVMIEATDRESFERQLEEGEFDVVLTDFNILGFEGLEVIRTVARSRPEVPVIVVTGTGSEEVAVRSLKEGAEDYVIKTPRHIAHLPHTVRQVLAARRDRLRLREQENNLRAVVENTMDGIVVIDQQGIVRFCNPAAERLLGVPAGNLLGTTFAYPLVAADSSVEIDLPRRPGGPGIAEIRVTTTRWDGKPGFIVALRDITERKRAAQQLNAVKQHLEHILSVSPSIVYVLNPRDLTATWVSPNILPALGYTEEEALQPAWWADHLHPEDRSRALLAKKSAWERGQAVREYRFQRKDGEYVWIRDQLRLIRDEEGEAKEIIGAWVDISECKKVEEQRAKLEEQLRQSQKMEAVGRLAGGVAHDFNNMLTIIIGYGESLMELLSPEDPAQRMVEEILRAARRSADLTRQLLAFSRKQPLQPEVLDLNQVVTGLEKMLRRMIGEDIELELSLAEDLAMVKVDPGQIEQVIMNLAVNARDAMPAGGRFIIETANARLDEAYSRSHSDVVAGDYVMLSVSDTGCGMDRETLSKIFEPFFTTKEMGRGTGLGLATVYGIVKQSGGHIWTYSEPGHGTRFKIYFPRVQKGVEEERPAPAMEEFRGRGEHVLVVEDEDSLRKLAATILQRLGYRVSLAANGDEALALVEQGGLKPDLLITDVVMPGMNGAMLAERVRQRAPDLKVLYMSGYTNDAISHHGVLAGGTPFLQKPFTLQDLAAKVRTVLANG